MNWTEWLIFILILQVIHGLGTWKLYIKAGRQAWEAFFPVYNAVILMKIISRPWWWVILIFLPIVNLIMIPAVWVETARAFGKDSKLDALLCILTLGFYLYYLNYVADVNFIENRDVKPKTTAGEWITSILFAIVAATIVHTYFFQPFVIPSSSLEKSLLVGDFLVVSKIHYGARTPMTTVGLPMVHDTIPKLGLKSYLFDDNFEQRETSWKNKLQLPYFRLPGFDTVERNDYVVFGQPADTLRNMNDFRPDRTYYKPIDKKTNLVKRCVATPGDTLEIKEGYVYINGKKNELPDRAQLQFSYKVELTNPMATQADVNRLLSVLDLADIDDGIMRNENDGSYIINAASDKAIAAFKNHPEVSSVERIVQPEGKYSFDYKGRPDIFPRDPNYSWNRDFFGPLYIPKAGTTTELTVQNLPVYGRLIQEYEGHHVFARGNEVILDGKVVNSYTFEKDYYWMMGDNRHNSIDARAWGFVPYDHIIGKPVFIWMSIDGINDGLKNWSIRWDRVFTTVNGSGKRNSVVIPFILLLILISLVNKWRKKNKVFKNENKEKRSDQTVVYAAINDRIKAAFIDSIILIMSMYLFSEVFELIGGVPDFVKIIVFIFIFFLYDPLFTSKSGGTIGHTLVGIQVKNEKKPSDNISLMYAIVRFALKATLGWVSLLSIGSSEKKTAIHDKAANSIVVKK